MLNISIGEILLIFIIFLVVFGPDQIPKAASVAGRVLRKVRQTTNTLRDIFQDDLAPSPGPVSSSPLQATQDRSKEPAQQQLSEPTIRIEMLSPARLPEQSCSIEATRAESTRMSELIEARGIDK